MPFFSITNPLTAQAIAANMNNLEKIDFDMEIKKALYAFETIQRL